MDCGLTWNSVLRFQAVTDLGFRFAMR